MFIECLAGLHFIIISLFYLLSHFQSHFVLIFLISVVLKVSSFWPWAMSFHLKATEFQNKRLKERKKPRNNGSFGVNKFICNVSLFCTFQIFHKALRIRKNYFKSF